MLLAGCGATRAFSAPGARTAATLPKPQVTLIRAASVVTVTPLSSPQQIVAAPPTATLTPGAPLPPETTSLPGLAPELLASPTNPQPLATLPGWPAAPFELRALNVPNVETIRLEDLKGKPTLLGFFATWCITCRTELPVVVKVHEQMKDRVQFVYIDYGETDPALNKFIQDMGINFPVLIDYDGKVGNAYRVLAMPTSFFIDSNGRIVNHYIGVMTEEILTDRLNRIIDQ